MMMTADHKIHDALPSGFTFADDLQEEQYAATGSVNGASKVVLVELEWTGPRIAVRLRPPRRFSDITSPVVLAQMLRLGFKTSNSDNDEARAWYIREYNNGYTAGVRGNGSRTWDACTSTAAWDDGYLDGRAGRAKWHLTYCADHDACGVG